MMVNFITWNSSGQYYSINVNQIISIVEVNVEEPFDQYKAVVTLINGKTYIFKGISGRNVVCSCFGEEYVYEPS